MITLTKEIILKANDYIPLERKNVWCRNVAAVSIRPVGVSGDNKGQAIPTPDRYEENTMARVMALASALAQNYLGVYGEDAVLQETDYDEILGSHLLNQLERMKSDRDVRDKIFNILYDYSELKKMLNTEIYSRLGHLNDTLSRIIIAIQSIEPTSFNELTEQVQEISTAVTEFEKKKAGRIAGDTAKAARKKNDDPERAARAAKIIEETKGAKGVKQ